MKGVEDYTNVLYQEALQMIKSNPDKPYLEGYYYYTLSGLTYASAKQYLFYVIKFIDDLDIQDVTQIKMDHYTKYMALMRCKSSSYQIAVYSGLKKFSMYLKANGYCEDYMQYVNRPKHVETQETRDRRNKAYMTKSEVKQVLNNKTTPQNKTRRPIWVARNDAMLSILLNTGIRRAELYKLDLSDINLENKSISIMGKGMKSRVVYMGDNTASKVKTWLKYREEYLGGVKNSALLITRGKERLGMQSIAKIAKEAGSIIEDKDITTHCYRGTYGTQLYEKTGDIYFVQDNMGHTSPTTTELYIRNKREDNSQRAAKLMDDLID